MATHKATEGAPAQEQPNATNDYDAPENYQNLDDAFARPPVQNAKDGPVRQASTLEDDSSTAEPAPASHGQHERNARMVRRRSVSHPDDYDVPDNFANLDELAVSPVENPDENRLYRHRSLEEARSQEHDYTQAEESRSGGHGHPPAEVDAEKAEPDVSDDSGAASKSTHVSRLATQIYTLSYLVFFAVFGTLARIGLQALTNYPGTPVSFTSIWPNFGGSLVMGFLAEDRMLFRDEWGTPTYENLVQEARNYREQNNTENAPHIDLAAAKKAHLAAKKSIPLYIGLATGFCGCFTSFSAFIRDIFLALSNTMNTTNEPRNGGYSFMALVGVIIITLSMSLGGLFVGAHLAIALEPFTPSIPYPFTRKVLDRLVVVLGWGCWIGAIIMSAVPPNEKWRGEALFALVFAPLGCLARFYISLWLNSRLPSFPVGTFVVNIFGTLVLGMSWDLAHVPLGGVVGCQVLQGVEDGFCGCLTTVSTWVAELSGLRRRNAYIYGATSVLVGLAAMVAVMGGLRWSDGFSPLQCTH